MCVAHNLIVTICFIHIHADTKEYCLTAAVTDWLTVLVSRKLLISKLNLAAAVVQSAFFTPLILPKTTNRSLWSCSSLAPPGFQSGTKACNHLTGMKSSHSEAVPSPETVAFPLKDPSVWKVRILEHALNGRLITLFFCSGSCCKSCFCVI